MPLTITPETLKGYKGQSVIRDRPWSREIRGILRREFLGTGFFLVLHRERKMGTRDNPKYRLRAGDVILVENGQTRKAADGTTEVVSQFRRYKFTG